MTNFENAERLRKLYLSRTPRKDKKKYLSSLAKMERLRLLRHIRRAWAGMLGANKEA